MFGNLIGRHGALEQVPQEGAVVVFSAGLSDKRTHGAVDAHDACLGFHGMQGGDVAEPDEPLGIVRHQLQVDKVHQLDGAITATVAQDGLDAGVLEGCGKVVGPFLGGACILARVQLAHVLADNGFKAPFLQDGRSVLDVRIGSGVGG